jgi:hypothetical protein
VKLTVKAAAVATGALLALGLSAPANAAPGDHGNGVGGCIDQLYGNATNPRADGHGVLPSQSPGPWLNNPTDPANPTWGPSMGALIQAYGFNAGQLHDGPCPF